MQVGGQVVRFLRGHLGYEIPSPALLAKIGNRFRREVSAFARERDIPVLRLAKPDRSRWDDRKLDHVRRYLGPSRARGPLRSRRDRHVPGIPVGLFRPRPSGTREGGQLSVPQGESPRWDLLLLVRREAPCRIPGAAGTDLEGCPWVQWLTWIRKMNGTIACQQSDGQTQVSGLRRCETRAIWRKLDCLKPSLQKMKSSIRRKGTRNRRHALRRHCRRVVATSRAWSVAQ
jgi:hypothetical protein